MTGSASPTCSTATGARLREVGTTNPDDRGRLPATRSGNEDRVSSSRSTRRTTARGASPRAPRYPSSPPLGGALVHDIGSGLLAPTRCCPTSRTRRPPCARARAWSPRAATSCSAVRRPGCCSATRSWSRRLLRHRSPARSGWTSSRWRRSRRTWPCRRPSPARSPPTPLLPSPSIRTSSRHSHRPPPLRDRGGRRRSRRRRRRPRGHPARRRGGAAGKPSPHRCAGASRCGAARCPPWSAG